MNVLVTGGAGYIGSHTCVELLSQGHDVIIFDNFSCNRSYRSAVALLFYRYEQNVPFLQKKSFQYISAKKGLGDVRRYVGYIRCAFSRRHDCLPYNFQTFA